jgi:hypothetical protein
MSKHIKNGIVKFLKDFNLLGEEDEKTKNTPTDST